MDSVRVRLLGELVVEGCDVASLGRRQARTVLKALALGHGHPVSVDRLAECLWGDQPPARAPDQISVLVSRLRRVLGANRLRHGDAGYTLTLDWLDVDALEAYTREAEVRLAARALGAARAAGSAGLALVRGRFLADEADAWWAEADAARVQQLVDRLHHAAAAAALEAGDTGAASELAEAALRSDPFDEAALRLTMSALAASGRVASALSRYAGFRARLADELGVNPSPDTEDLHRRLLLLDAGPDASPDAPDAPDAGPDASHGGGAVPVGAVGRGGLPGRADQLAYLDGLLDRAVAGHLQVAMVEGEAGIGKSRLLAVFAGQAARRGVTVVRASGHELGRTLPLQPLLDALFELVRREDPDDPEAVLGPDAALLGPLVGYRSQARATTQMAALTDPGAGQALLFMALNSALHHRGLRSPLALVLDDLHLADPATTAWLAQAGRRLAGSRLAVVAARRSEEGTPVPGAEVVSLGPLDRAATAEVVGAARADELYQRTGGHPLFLVELAASPDDPLPATILQAVDGRCARAGPAAAATIRAAAVLGSRIDIDLLAAATDVAPAVLLDHLEEGARRLLLTEGAAFEFRHGLARQALASTVGPARTAFLHRQAGRVLASRPGADPLVAAHHARLGGDRELAAAMLLRGARAAVARFGQADAAVLLDDAIELADSAEARVERARVRSMLLRYADARADIDAAVALGAGAEALEAGAWAAHFERRFGDALRLADQGAGQAEGTDLRASCLGLGGWVSLAAGDLPGARRRLTGALKEQPANPLAHAWRGWLCVNEGRPDLAAVVAPPEPGHPLAAYRFPNLYGLMATTMATAMLGRPDEALLAAVTLDRDARRMAAARWLPRAANLRGWVVRNLGEGAEADELNEAGLEQARALDMAEPLANGLLDLAAGRLMAGDLDGARARLDEAAVVYEVDFAFRWRVQLRHRLLAARLDLAAGRPEVAWRAADRLAVDAAARGAVRCQVQAELVAATAALGAGGSGAAPSDHDHDHVESLLRRLPTVAGTEAWWITAEVADAFESAGWRELACRRLADLLPRAGRYRDALTRAAAGRGLG